MIDTGDYSVEDIKKLLLVNSKRSITLGLGYRFKYSGNVVEFIGIEDSIILYNTKTLEPVRKFGLFYKFIFITGVKCEFLVEQSDFNPNEWERLN